MSEKNKALTEELSSAVKELPEHVQASLMSGWMNEAIGAKKVCDMGAVNKESA